MRATTISAACLLGLSVAPWSHGQVELPPVSVGLRAEVTSVKQGYPLAFRVTIGSTGSQPLLFSSLEDDFWPRARLMHGLPGEDEEIRSSGVGPHDSGFNPFPAQVSLEPGKPLVATEYLGIQIRKGPKQGGESNPLEPVTNAPGIHTFWVEFQIEDAVVKSRVISIRVNRPEEGEAEALEYLQKMKGLEAVYDSRASVQSHLDDLRVLALDKGDNGYADLARMRLAEWHLFWCEKGTEESALAKTGLSLASNLERARELSEMIDLDRYLLPSRASALKRRLEKIAMQGKSAAHGVCR
jgi:hypothetical protein